MGGSRLAREPPCLVGRPGCDISFDIARIRQDTGYAPAYGTERAVAGYIGWLRAAHER